MVLKLQLVLSIAVLSGIAIAQPGPSAPMMGGPTGPYYSPSPYGGPSAGPYQGGSYMGGSPSSGSGPIPSTRFSPYSAPGRMPSYGAPGMSSGPMPSGPSYSPATPPENSRFSKNTAGPVPTRPEDFRSRTLDLQQTNPELSPQDRMKIPLIDYKYRQGLNNYNDGNSSRDEYKMRIGIQQMDDAKNIGRLKSEASQGNRGSDNRDSGRNQRNR